MAQFEGKERNKISNPTRKTGDKKTSSFLKPKGRRTGRGAGASIPLRSNFPSLLELDFPSI